MITVDTDEAKSRLFTLLASVEEQGEVVVICRDGSPVAELRAINPSLNKVNPLQMHPELAGKILYDPTEIASEDEWPNEFR